MEQERERKALLRCSDALGRCRPSWFADRSSGTDPLCPLCLDVSIFSLKEIQLQKDPGYRGSAFQQSGRTGESHTDLSQMVPQTGVTPSGSHIGKSQTWLLFPCFSPQITPKASLLVTSHGTQVTSSALGHSSLFRECLGLVTS